MPDLAFSEPRLARLYDAREADRGDLDFYAALVDRFAAHRVVDIGCGTGSLACALARRGIDVIGVDPARASLDVARAKAGADRVRWILAAAADVPPVAADLATMTGNVAQVFVEDDDWAAALQAAHRCLRHDGRLVFETRDPARQAWRGWTRAQTWERIEVAGVGGVATWCEVTRVDGPLVAFREHFEFEADGAALCSDSVLRFRTHDEVSQSLEANGFVIDEVLDAPDRPGLEFVFVARASASANVQAIR